MNKKYLVIVILIIAVAIIAFFFWRQDTSSKQAVTAVRTPLVETPTATPASEQPNKNKALSTPNPDESSPTVAPKVVTPTPMPSLGESDQKLTQDIASLEGGNEITSALTEEQIIRKVVRAAFGLSEGKIVREHRPLKSPKGEFLAQKINNQNSVNGDPVYRISRDNYARYASYLSLLTLINNDQSLRLYQNYRPLFEEAYNELGIGKGSFHATLIKAIDVLIDAPVSQEAIILTQPSVRFKFQDPELEKLPPAHKLMIRMGNENAEALKLELKTLREKLNSLDRE